MNELKEAWRVFGCAVCGRTVPEEGAGSGFDLEMHHTVNRSQGGHGSLQIGLCGGLTPNRCHQRVTENRLAIVLEDVDGAIEWPGAEAAWVQGPAWVDLDTGEVGTLRLLNGLVEPSQAVSLVQQVATKRLRDISGLAGRVERDLRAIALLLLESWEARDHAVLGCGWDEYLDQAGLSPAQGSRLLTTAQVFRGRWLERSEEELAALPATKLYQAALRVKHDGVDVDSALSEAVATPTAQLIAKRRGEETTERCKCECPECGRVLWHDRA